MVEEKDSIEREVIQAFGNNVDAFMAWWDQVPLALRGRLQRGQNPAGEIYVTAARGAFSDFERAHLPMLPPTALPELPDEACADVAGLPRDPGPVPQELLHVPGFVDELMSHTLSTVPYPNPPLAFAGALTMLSHLTGRRYCDRFNMRTNIYLIALAESGTGKDQPRKVNMNLADAIGFLPTMANKFASPEGLEDSLLLYPASFFQLDEADTLFQCLKQKDPNAEKTYANLLDLYTSSNSVFTMRKKAIQSTVRKSNPFDLIRARGIKYPHLVLLGTAIPSRFYLALSERSLENGLLSRCLVLEAEKRGELGTPRYAPFPAQLLETARYLADNSCARGANLDDLDAEPPDPRPVVVPETPAAAALLASVARAADARYHAAEGNCAAQTLWTRAAEKVRKLALLHAISISPREPVVVDEGVRWAWHLVDHLTRRTLFQCSMYVADGSFDTLRQKFLRMLLESRQKTQPRSDLLRKLHVTKLQFDELVETLVESGQIEKGIGRKGGAVYTLVG